MSEKETLPEGNENVEIDEIFEIVDKKTGKVKGHCQQPYEHLLKLDHFRKRYFIRKQCLLGAHTISGGITSD